MKSSPALVMLALISLTGCVGSADEDGTTVAQSSSQPASSESAVSSIIASSSSDAFGSSQPDGLASSASSIGSSDASNNTSSSETSSQSSVTAIPQSSSSSSSTAQQSSAGNASSNPINNTSSSSVVGSSSSVDTVSSSSSLSSSALSSSSLSSSSSSSAIFSSSSSSSSSSVVSIPDGGCFSGGGNPANGNLNVSLSASRTTGVAPLIVFFSSDGTTSTETNRPFHELSYCWGFDDEGSGNYFTTGRSKNTSLGPLASHVFETPGTYTVSLTVRDTQNRQQKRNITITVTDPDQEFMGADTVCLSGEGNYSGCPIGAIQVQGNSVEDLQSYVNPGTRLLLRRGEVFSSNTDLLINVSGPGIIGAYGSGARPFIQTETNGVFRLSHFNPDDVQFNDWRIMDLEIDGLGNEHTSIAVGHRVNRFLALRLKGQNLGGYISIGNTGGNEIGIEDSHFSDLLGGDEPDKDGGGFNMAYISATWLSLQGNYYNNSTEGEHVLRIRFAQNAIISNNDIGHANGPRLLLKLHGLNWGSETTTDYTENVVISENIFRGTASQDWMIFLGPASRDEQRLRDLLLERNQFIRAHTNIKVPLLIQAEDVTVRDNIFHSTVSGNYAAIVLETLASDNYAKNIDVIQNTFSGGTSGNSSLEVMGFRSQTNLTPVLGENINIYNNLVFSNGSTRIIGNISDEEVVNLNMGNNIQTTTSPFVGGGSGWSAFRLDVDGVGVDAADPSWSTRWDFTRSLRDNTPDAGALEYH